MVIFMFTLLRYGRDKEAGAYLQVSLQKINSEMYKGGEKAI